MDGEVYSRDWIEEYIFDSEKSFKQRSINDREWVKYEYDLSFLGHPNVAVWDYHFMYDSIMDEVCPPESDRKCDKNNLFRLFNYKFLDYENPIKNEQVFKTRPPKIWYSYNDTGKQIFNKKIIRSVYPFSGYFSAFPINAYEELMKNSLININAYNCLIAIPLNHFIKLDIYTFPDDLKRWFQQNYMDTSYTENILFPDTILMKKLDQKEIDKIMLNILKRKIIYKRKNQSK